MVTGRQFDVSLLMLRSMVNHSCDPNCRVYWASPGDRFVLETRRKVDKGKVKLSSLRC